MEEEHVVLIMFSPLLKRFFCSYKKKSFQNWPQPITLKYYFAGDFRMLLNLCNRAFTLTANKSISMRIAKCDLSALNALNRKKDKFRLRVASVLGFVSIITYSNRS